MLAGHSGQGAFTLSTVQGSNKRLGSMLAKDGVVLAETVMGVAVATQGSVAVGIVLRIDGTMEDVTFGYGSVVPFG